MSANGLVAMWGTVKILQQHSNPPMRTILAKRFNFIHIKGTYTKQQKVTQHNCKDI